MRFRKIAGIEKSICTAEQKIAYNFAFRYREFDGSKELCQLLAVVSADIKSNDKIMRNYDIDSIVHCLRNGYVEYRKNYPAFIMDYETIGKVFYSLYPVE